jgi:pyridoxal phosphate enzyme (YggS family)
MSTHYTGFTERVTAITKRIEAACLSVGRDPSEVRLLAVTKTHGPEAVELSVQAGLNAVGENRVQEAMAKKQQVRLPVRWELIGHLQSNKVGKALDCFDCIQSVDRLELIERLAKGCRERNLTAYPIYLQINAGEDPAKKGADRDGSCLLLESALNAGVFKIEGLMTIGIFSTDPQVSRRCFSALREIRNHLSDQFGVPLKELSMGMSDDLEIAIECGSTCVRVGTALFGQRAKYE